MESVVPRQERSGALLQQQQPTGNQKEHAGGEADMPSPSGMKVKAGGDDGFTVVAGRRRKMQNGEGDATTPSPAEEQQVRGELYVAPQGVGEREAVVPESIVARVVSWGLGALFHQQIR